MNNHEICDPRMIPRVVQEHPKVDLFTNLSNRAARREGIHMVSGRVRCLMIVAFEALLTGTVAQHTAALRGLSAHEITMVHIGTLKWLKLDLSQFDVIVFHYSIVIAKGFHLGSSLRGRLAGAKALKVAFIQDEYRWIDATAEAIKELGISVLFTVVNQDAVDKVYHHTWLNSVRKETTLTGFVDEQLLQVRVPSYSKRGVDVAYRARKVPYWLGSFAMEKWSIGERFRAQAERYQLRCDISSDQSARLYGKNWIRFLSSAKAVLGTESGASVCDFSGTIQSNVECMIESNPGTAFEAVRDKLLQGSDGRIVIHVISPRIFEAAALRILMINYPGEYSGRLIPWRHYVPLAKDHSNLEEVIETIRNPEKAERIIEAAYREVACDPANSFRAMVEHFDGVVTEELRLRLGATPGYASAICRWYLESISWLDFSLLSRTAKARRLAFQVARSVVRSTLPRFCRDWIKAGFYGPEQRGNS